MPAADYRGKRALDLVVAGAGLVVMLPLLGAIALVVRLSSPGGAIHRAERVGRQGRTFTLYKFRSMRVGSGTGPAVTPRGDARITRVGAVLRRTKLDELPQLFNVLRGDMSIVGPRPEDPRYVDRYTCRQRQILQWRPGITSPASVAYRNEETILAAAEDLDAAYGDVMAAKIEIDAEYLQRASVLGDLHCIARTLTSVLQRER